MQQHEIERYVHFWTPFSSDVQCGVETFRKYMCMYAHLEKPGVVLARGRLSDAACRLHCIPAEVMYVLASGDGSVQQQRHASRRTARAGGGVGCSRSCARLKKKKAIIRGYPISLLSKSPQTRGTSGKIQFAFPSPAGGVQEEAGWLGWEEEVMSWTSSFGDVRR